MKQVAVVLAALLTLLLVTPAFAQPFADVPTDHWAYDAIAELAAKGLVEGYPDGAFRGDRAMTRYEMAMVVARLLARIEAIKIPPLPPDLVRQADLAKAQAANAAARAAITTKLGTVQRLVAEFRAELAALGVRVTAVEEELAAIRARLDNTRVTGDGRIRYNVFPTGPSGGNKVPDARLRTRLTFTGRVSPNVETVIRLWMANNANCTGCNYDVRLGYDFTYSNVSFDLAYVDVRNYLYATLWRVGRQFYTLSPFGPFGVGLLYDPANSLATGTFAPGTAAIGTLPLNMTTPGTSDGIRADWVFGPINVTTALFRLGSVGALFTSPNATGTGTGTNAIKDYRIVRVTSGALIPGWTLGGAYFAEVLNHGAVVTRDSGGTGWSIDFSGRPHPAVSFYAEYASWTGRFVPPTAASPAINAWRVGGNLNIGMIVGGGIPWSPTLDFAYHRYGPHPPFVGACFIGSAPPGPFSSCFPPNTYATTIVGQTYAWNMNGWLARLNLTISPTTTAFVLYEWGNTNSAGTAVPVGSPYSEWWVRLAHTISPRTTVTFNYYRTAGPNVSGVNAVNVSFYRMELLWSW